jgi:hypothetical protein
VGITVSECQLKQTRTGTGSLTSSPQQLRLVPVSSDFEDDEHFARIKGTDSPVWDFTGPVEFSGHRGCHGCDGGAILVEFWGNGASAQEGMF